MNKPLLPISPSHPEDAADLDERIFEVEARLMAREDKLRGDVKALGAQLGERLQPRRLLAPALTAVAGLVLLTLWRRHDPAASAGATAATAPVARPALLALLAGLPWRRLFDLAWPLVQRRLQARRRGDPHAEPAGPR